MAAALHSAAATEQRATAFQAIPAIRPTATGGGYGASAYGGSPYGASPYGASPYGGSRRMAGSPYGGGYALWRVALRRAAMRLRPSWQTAIGAVSSPRSPGTKHCGRGRRPAPRVPVGLNADADERLRTRPAPISAASAAAAVTATTSRASSPIPFDNTLLIQGTPEQWEQIQKPARTARHLAPPGADRRQDLRSRSHRRLLSRR